jgi:hypothetical protein
MLKMLNRTNNQDIRKITDMLIIKNNNLNIDIDFHEKLVILDNKVHLEDTIMYDEYTNQIFIYEEITHSMITDQNKIDKFICIIINKELEKSSLKINKLKELNNTLEIIKDIV